MPLIAAVIVVSLVLAGAAVGVTVALTSGSPRTGAACVAGDWHTDQIQVTPDVTHPGTIDASYRADGTGEYHLVLRDDAQITDKYDFTYHYAATGTTITYTQVSGTMSGFNLTGDGTTTSQHVSQLSSETYTCGGDRLTIGSDRPGLSQTLSRR